MAAVCNYNIIILQTVL